MWKRLAASFLSFIFLLFSSLFFTGWGVYSTLSEKSFYSGKVVDIVHSYLVNEGPKSIKIEDLSVVTEDDIRNIIREIVPKDELNKTIDFVHSQLTESVVPDGGEVKIMVDMNWLKGKDQIVKSKILEILYERLPACANSEEFVGDLKCLPKGLPKEDFENKVGNILGNGPLSDIENQFDINFQAPILWEGKTISQVFGEMALLFFVAGVVLLILLLSALGLVIYRPFWRIVKWEFKTIFISAMMLSLSLIGILYLPETAGGFYSNYFGDDVTYQYFLDIFMYFLKIVSKKILIFSVPVAIISLGLYITALIFERRSNGTNEQGRIS